MKLSFIYSVFVIVYAMPISVINIPNSNSKNIKSVVLETKTSINSPSLINQGQLNLSLFESTAFANGESAADGLLILIDTEGNNAIDINDAI